MDLVLVGIGGFALGTLAGVYGFKLFFLWQVRKYSDR